MDLIFVTSNARKFEVAQQSLAGFDAVLHQHQLDLPEIQSTSVEEVGRFKATEAVRLLQKPVVVADGGFYFHGLNGFPGPFIKFINSWLTGEGLWRLMQGIEDRRIEAIECVSYCAPNLEAKTFCHSYWGSAAMELGKPGRGPIDEVFIPQGFDQTLSSIAPPDQLAFWSSGTSWPQLAQWLADAHNPNI